MKHKATIYLLFFCVLIISSQTVCAQETKLISKGSEWHYLDDGSTPKDNWITKMFDTQKWKSGKAQLGYGDSDETTLINFGKNKKNKFITTYFRKKFHLDNVKNIKSVQLSIKYDDGAIIYLNGTEVVRPNMPKGIITNSTLALNAINGSTEKKFHLFDVDVNLLNLGENVLAVEVHQAKSTSSDLSFDLELSATFFKDEKIKSPRKEIIEI